MKVDFLTFKINSIEGYSYFRRIEPEAEMLMLPLGCIAWLGLRCLMSTD
jgi:hypothetical protein